MKYRYQMHTHTSPTSKCSHMTPAELCEALHREGYSGCVITNHFFHGNTGVSRELPWEEFVCAYERDWLECKREGEKYGLDILFGIEEGVEGYSEILLYGLTPEMLYAHPELKECGAEGWYSIMHGLGVLVIQAHPFRVLRPIPNPVALPPKFIDGIEVYNGGNPLPDNEKAKAFAAEHPELILTSGADTHDANSVGINGIMTDRRLKTVDDLVAVLRSGEYELITN